ncbi:MAG: biotin synthase, partial [Arcobacter sp.]
YETCQNVNKVGLRLVCGGIFGLGETQEQRISMLNSIASLNPMNVPLNFFHPNEALPLVKNSITRKQAFELIELARKIIPNAKKIMVAGGRELMFKEEQYKIFEKGANAFVIGDYLTTAGKTPKDDIDALEKLGFKIKRERD